MGTTYDYILGHAGPELERLAHQGSLIAPATRAILRLAGLEAGMRVLDLGTGIGDVALIVAELVGPTGQVVGLDREERALAVARERDPRLTFVRGDVADWQDETPFDAIVGRLVHMHHPDPVGVIRHQSKGLRPGGTYVAMEWDYLTTRADPPSSLLDRTIAMMAATVRLGGVDPACGARLDTLLSSAGLDSVQALGMRPFTSVEEGCRSVHDLAANFHPAAVRAGVVGEGELGIDTLLERLVGELRDAEAALVMPTLVGAWGRTR